MMWGKRSSRLESTLLVPKVQKHEDSDAMGAQGGGRIVLP